MKFKQLAIALTAAMMFAQMGFSNDAPEVVCEEVQAAEHHGQGLVSLEKQETEMNKLEHEKSAKKGKKKPLAKKKRAAKKKRKAA